MTQQKTIANIPMTPVASSQVAAIGHDGGNTLRVEFPGKGDKPGSLYDYSGFTAEDFAEFLAAESKGSHFINKIKRYPDKYPYTRVR